MKAFLAVAALAILTTTAYASDSLTVAECLNVARGLKALDAVGATPEQVAPPTNPQQYRFGGAVRGAQGLNLAALQRVGDGVEKARQSIVLEIFGGNQVKPGPDMDKVVAELQKALEKPCDVTPARINLSDLKLDENSIPLSTLAALAPIINADK